MEPNSPKKIQFAVPMFQSQLDPQAAEHIRKRRPTPATLVIYRGPETTDDRQTMSHQGEAHNAEPCPAQRKHSVYTQPNMKGREPSADSWRGHEDKDRLSQLSHSDTASEESSGAPPRRKDTPYQHQPPFTPGARLLKTQAEITFREEEEEKEEEEVKKETEEEDEEEDSKSEQKCDSK